MTNFTVPTKATISVGNQSIFDTLHKALGFVPNLYAVMAYSETGLGNYLQFQNGKTSLTKKEKEAVNLVVSQVNGCRYCQSAHTVLGKMNGFSDDQVLEIRGGSASFDPKLHALVDLAEQITSTKGHPDQVVLQQFFDAGYTQGSLVDVVMAIADKVAMNYLHNITQVPIDFPVAPALEAAAV